MYTPHEPHDPYGEFDENQAGGHDDHPNDQMYLEALERLVRHGTDDMVEPVYKINGGRHRYVGRFAGYAWGISMRLERLLNDLDRIEDAVLYERATDQQGAADAEHAVHTAVKELRPGAHLQRKIFAPQIPVAAQLGNYLASARRLAEEVSALCGRCGLQSPD